VPSTWSEGLVRTPSFRHQIDPSRLILRTAEEIFGLPSNLIPYFLRTIDRLKEIGMKPLIQLAETFESWKEEIVRMWRFTRNNAITEGFHTKMEMISRRAFGFRNFENCRLRVKVLCG
jgi:transposase